MHAYNYYAYRSQCGSGGMTLPLPSGWWSKSVLITMSYNIETVYVPICC